MDALQLGNGYLNDMGLAGCIFGCKAQRAADRAAAAAAEADKIQAAKIAEQKETNALIVKQNAEAIADTSATTDKATKIIIGGAAGLAAILLIIKLARRKKKS